MHFQVTQVNQRVLMEQLSSKDVRTLTETEVVLHKTASGPSKFHGALTLTTCGDELSSYRPGDVVTVSIV